MKILGYDHNWDQPSYPETLLADPTASSYLAGSAFHCYAGDVSAQSTVEAAYPTKGIWFTECSGTVGSSFAGDLQWNAENLLIGATRNWARSISLWNLALDQNSGPKNGGCTNCRGVVTIDDSTSPATITQQRGVLRARTPGEIRGSGRLSHRFEHFRSRRYRRRCFSKSRRVDRSAGVECRWQHWNFTVSWTGQNFTYSLAAGAVATFRWK